MFASLAVTLHGMQTLFSTFYLILFIFLLFFQNWENGKDTFKRLSLWNHSSRLSAYPKWIGLQFQGRQSLIVSPPPKQSCTYACEMLPLSECCCSKAAGVCLLKYVDKNRFTRKSRETHSEEDLCAWWRSNFLFHCSCPHNPAVRPSSTYVCSPPPSCSRMS